MMSKQAVLEPFGDAHPAPLSNARAERTRIKMRDIEAREFAFARGALFTVFLPVAAVSRLLPRASRPLPGVAGQHRSVIAEARAAANEITPFLFSR